MYVVVDSWVVDVDVVVDVVVDDACSICSVWQEGGGGLGSNQ